MFKRTLAMTLIGATLAVSATVSAEEDRSAVLERIKPIGTVTIAGSKMAAPAATETAAEPAAAPATEAAAPAAPAEAPAAVAEAAPAAAAEVDGMAVYKSACFICHDTGAAGAPKLGDHALWDARVAQGKETLVQNAINGKNAMPPKGGRADLTDEQISAAVDYMVNQLN